MNYIVFDLEFNQSFDFKTGSSPASNPECPFEIIPVSYTHIYAEGFSYICLFTYLYSFLYLK